jgi:hypothetical protein
VKIVPYIVSWSDEKNMPTVVVEHPWAGIAYADETLADRDERGVLWTRIASRPGKGRPLFGEIHSLRQRKVMRRLLCGICGGQPDRNDQGVLWLLRDFRDDWPNWPEHMASREPPVCLPCAHQSVQLCPSLRKGYVAVRVGHSEVSGVYGIRYRAGKPFPVTVDDAIVTFDDPDIHWTRAHQLVRELLECTIVDLDPC